MRGVLACILQKEETTKEKIERQRGTLKVARLIGDEKIKGLVVLPLYDTKPFYMMINECTEVK